MTIFHFNKHVYRAPPPPDSLSPFQNHQSPPSLAKALKNRRKCAEISSIHLNAMSSKYSAILELLTFRAFLTKALAIIFKITISCVCTYFYSLPQSNVKHNAAIFRQFHILFVHLTFFHSSQLLLLV